MIWLGAVAIGLLTYMIWTVTFLLRELSRQLEALGEMLILQGKQAEEQRQLLAEISGHTDRIPRPPPRRLPEYPGDEPEGWPQT